MTGVLGGTGFIGSYLCQYLASRSQKTLRLFARNSLRKSPLPSGEVLTGDLLSRRDCELFASDLKVIYYLAHTNTPLNSDLDQPTDAALNLAPLLNLLDAIRRLGTKPHIVYFSSGGAVYKPRPERIPYRESDPCAPESSYGILKVAAEQYLRLAADRGEITATALRVGNAYGALLPEFRMQGFIGVALNHLLHGRPVRVFGDPGNVRDYVHLEDVCAMAETASLPRRAFDIVNVGSGKGHSVNDLLSMIRDCHGSSFPISMSPKQGEGLRDWVVLDCTHAREEFGWSAAVDLRVGIVNMLAAWGEMRAKARSGL